MLSTAPCSNPGIPNTGKRIGVDFRHGKTVAFTCTSKDYVMVGAQSIKCTNGQWSNTKPSCKGEYFLFCLFKHVETKIKFTRISVLWQYKKNNGVNPRTYFSVDFLSKCVPKLKRNKNNTIHLMQ